MSSSNQDYLSSQLYKIRHSASHVMAQAVLEFFPQAKIAIGPPIDEGFYYDFELPRPLTEEDLDKIEARMKEILKGNHAFERVECSAEEARKLFKDQPYKIELISDILDRGTDEHGDKTEQGGPPLLTVYRHAAFTDLCRGPHVSSTKEINPAAVKLLRIAGAYWRGDEHNQMLQRIYGTAFEKPEDLSAYLQKVEQAKKRDHRVLGKQLDLFSFSDAVGPGLCLWHPKGALVRYAADKFSQEAHLLNGYDWVVTPHIGRANLWETSGHLEFYRDSMYRPIDIEGEQYYLKPMNCPFHIQIYKSRPRSYREMPKRYAEFGTVYRYERSGVLSGFTRVRGFTQDDAHIFCTKEQVAEEILAALRFSLYVLRSFGLNDFKAYIATRPQNKFVGSAEEWDLATETLKLAVKSEGVKYEIDEGGGAFYGPKIDLKLLDSLGREWQLSTVQFDFNLPVRFGLEYIGADGKAHTPVMVHRALFGSFERFFAMLIEQYEGAFPLWIAPVQIVLVPIASRHGEYCRRVQQELKAAGLRVELDDSDERMQAKIRNAEMQKTPYVFVVGDKEVANQTVAVRGKAKGDLGPMSLAAFLDSIKGDLAAGKPAPLA